MPSDLLQDLARVLLLRDYNTRVVLLGVALLGAASGLAGTFLLLRKRALLSDAISHATLPGVGLAFMIMAAAGGTGKHLLGLLTGAALTGALGMLSALAIRRYSRLKDDAALGITLSVFFAVGIALVGVASRLPDGQAAGLTNFIYGKPASMTLRDAQWIGLAAALVAAGCTLLFKEFALLAFDQNFAATQGWPVGRLDILLMTMIVLVTVIGLQAVGLILVVALLIIPPAAARFWTNDLRRMAVTAAGLGAASGLIGAGLSAVMANLPAGAVIVMTASAFFVASLLLGRKRGIIWAMARHAALRRKVAREHLLRSVWELAEERHGGTPPEQMRLTVAELGAERAWRGGELRRTLRRAAREELVQPLDEGEFVLTPKGAREAGIAARNHRLWEMYLLTHADVAPAQVDRGADRVEHVLDAALVARLEKLLEAEGVQMPVPPSPHELGGRGA